MNGNADSKQEYCGLKYILSSLLSLHDKRLQTGRRTSTILAGTVGGEVEASAFK